MNEWIRVEAAVPPFNRNVLVCDEGENIYIAFRRTEDEYNEHWVICKEDCDCRGCTGPVVAWMELPDLPIPCERYGRANE